ncbi:hypothetical protein EV562_101103 [Streptomyces sp. BK208]|uniref:hypothetical protein n=1 Tax=Streptomyces sp. BK208 TaxID=2512150 RepID=UPI0010D60E63|nr:hypothetical protein [Streptomyces sp. BK208]TDT42134.1 hypothetical protein EV562_101103 [Streptomyces sp. BK208]
MQHHAEDDEDRTTDTGPTQEPEPYDDVVYDDGIDDGAEPVEEGGAVDEAASVAEEHGPDVFLDVPQLKVDELHLDVEDLRARVSLQAEVLDLLKLNVGADVALGQVHLDIAGVEAQARLKVRLDNVALIINRVLTTLDRNPQILEDLARGVGSAVHDVGRGAGKAVRDVGEGAGSAVEDVGEGAGSAVEGIGGTAADAVGEVARGAGDAAGNVGEHTGKAVGDVGGAAARIGDGDGEDEGDVAAETGRAAVRGVRRTPKDAGAREAKQETGRRSATRRRRAADDESGATRPVRRRADEGRGEPP